MIVILESDEHLSAQLHIHFEQVDHPHYNILRTISISTVTDRFVPAFSSTHLLDCDAVAYSLSSGGLPSGTTH